MLLLMMMMMMMMMMMADAFILDLVKVQITLAAFTMALTMPYIDVIVVEFLVTVWIMMMMIAMSSFLLRGLVAEHGDYHLLVGCVAGCLRVRLGDGRWNEAVGAPLWNDHVHLAVGRRHDAQTLLGERVPLEDAVRAAAAVGARLELGEVVGKFQCGQAVRRHVAVVVIHVAYRRHYTSTCLTSTEATCAVQFQIKSKFIVKITKHNRQMSLDATRSKCMTPLL